MNQEGNRKDTKFANAKPYFFCAFNSLISAASTIVSKVSLDEGMKRNILIVYGSAFGTIITAFCVLIFERKNESKITRTVTFSIIILGLLRTLLRVAWFAGLQYTSAAFSSSITNIIPSMTFVLAVIFRMEKLKIGKLSSKAKIGGTIVAFGGATLMTLYKGNSVLSFHKALYHSHHQHNDKNLLQKKNLTLGSLFLATQCLVASLSVLLQVLHGVANLLSIGQTETTLTVIFYTVIQARMIKQYPAPMRLTALSGAATTLTSAVLAAITDHKVSSWKLSWDITLIAPLYNGMLIFGLAGYVQTLVLGKRGPVFSTTFRPLSTVFVTIMSLFILGEELKLGEILGAVLIIVGLYAILWGKEAEEKEKSVVVNIQSENENENVKV